MRQATAWRVLNADDAQILGEDTEAQQGRDLALFRRSHQRRGTDPDAAPEELRRRTGGQARELAEAQERDRGAPRGARLHPELDH